MNESIQNMLAQIPYSVREHLQSGQGESPNMIEKRIKNLFFERSKSHPELTDDFIKAEKQSLRILHEEVKRITGDFSVDIG